MCCEGGMLYVVGGGVCDVFFECEVVDFDFEVFGLELVSVWEFLKCCFVFD